MNAREVFATSPVHQVRPSFALRHLNAEGYRCRRVSRPPWWLLWTLVVIAGAVGYLLGMPTT